MLRQLFIVLNAGGLADWTSQLAAPAARAPVPIVLLVPCLSAPLAHAAVPVVIGVSDLPARAAGTATPIVLSPTQRLVHDTTLDVEFPCLAHLCGRVTHSARATESRQPT